ncbi:MAG: lysine biosynthesis protein LysW [Anaerolineae bacterium]|jgi:lysine biosynthesis protein LysW
MAIAYCLDCGARIYLGRKPWVGQAAFCDSCGTDLEVTRVNPPELDWTDNLVDVDREEEAEPEWVPA